MSRRFLAIIAAVFVVVAAHAASMGPGSLIGSGGNGGMATASVTYPRVSVQVGGVVSISPTVSGITPGTYSVVAGVLPDGLSLNSSTGAITGSVTTTALLTGKTARGGASPGLGRYVVVIDVGDSAGTNATAAIDVYAIDIPNPESLTVFSDAYKSGSGFTDALKVGLTWTKAAGTTDPTLTDSVSPLGYSHEFDGATYFTGADVLTKQASAHATIALLMRPRVESVSFPIPFTVGATVGSTSHGLWFFHSSFVDTSIGTGSGVTGVRTAEYPFRSYILSADSGLGSELWVDGFDKATSDTSAFSTNGTAGPYIGTHPASAGTYLIKSAIAEAAFWPRTLRGDSARIASLEYCWRRGVSLKDCNGNNYPSGNSVTIDLTEPSSDHPITYSGSYTLTGTATGNDAVTCSASPSTTETCTCTGTTSWSCTVSVTPTTANEGVETISIVASSSTGQAIARQDVGFYVASPHTAFDARSFDGSNNATVATGDAIGTWTNLGTSGKNITQSTAGAKPTARLDRGVSPFARFDGGDHLDAATAADWTFLHDGSTYTVEVVYAADSYSSTQYLANTNDAAAGACTTTGKGMCLTVLATTTFGCGIQSGAAQVTSCGAPGAVLVAGRFHSIHIVHADDGGAGVDLTAYSDNTSRTTNSRSGAFGVGGGSALRIGRSLGSTTGNVTGDIVAFRIYSSALSSTQRGINSAVDSWSVGGNW